MTPLLLKWLINNFTILNFILVGTFAFIIARYSLPEYHSFCQKVLLWNTTGLNFQFLFAWVTPLISMLLLMLSIVLYWKTPNVFQEKSRTNMGTWLLSHLMLIPFQIHWVTWKKMWLLVKAQMQFFAGTEHSGFGSVMFSWRQQCLLSQHPTPTEFQQELANNLPLGSSENPGLSLQSELQFYLQETRFFWGLLRYCFLKQQNIICLQSKYSNSVNEI